MLGLSGIFQLKQRKGKKEPKETDHYKGPILEMGGKPVRESKLMRDVWGADWGKQIVFLGGEFSEESSWSKYSLDEHLVGGGKGRGGSGK